MKRKCERDYYFNFSLFSNSSNGNKKKTIKINRKKKEKWKIFARDITLHDYTYLLCWVIIYFSCSSRHDDDDDCYEPLMGILLLMEFRIRYFCFIVEFCYFIFFPEDFLEVDKNKIKYGLRLIDLRVIKNLRVIIQNKYWNS